MLLGSGTHQDMERFMACVNRIEGIDLLAKPSAPMEMMHRSTPVAVSRSACRAHLYGLTREELDYILDTFPLVRRKGEERWGEYQTKRLVLDAWEKLERSHFKE